MKGISSYRILWWFVVGMGGVLFAQTPPDTTQDTTFTSGQTEEEVVEAEAQFRIDDAEKPLSILAIPARTVMDSFLDVSNDQLMLQFFLPAESLIFMASRLPQPYLRKPPVYATLIQEVVLEIPDVKQTKKYDRWRVEIFDALGNPVKTFAGNGKPPNRILWDGISESGMPMTPGEAYSVILVRITPRDKERTTPIGIIKIPSIFTTTPTGERVAIWDSRTIFQEKTAIPLPRAFRGPLQEMVNILLTYTKQEAKIYVYADPEYLGVDQANYLTDFLENQIPFSTASWKVDVRFYEPGEFRVPRVEVWVK